ncbi:barstar family protein [Corynebacterium durum]|uniref:barstar family protein n=1 Tax=Corynebacterium durum TaxID=61592 RepID=UPI00058EB5B7|nr:barstar family protein [Corynebacterium durum]
MKRTYMVDGIIMTEYTINLSAVRTAPGFLQLMSKELSFPGYFGGTFDAFEECFRDLAWLSDEHIVIHIRGLDSVAARNPMLAASIKESILFCADYWRSTKQIERDVQIELATETQ